MAEPIKPKVKLTDQNGNIYNLLNITMNALRHVGRHADADKMRSEVFSSDSYDKALKIIGEYVEVE